MVVMTDEIDRNAFPPGVFLYMPGDEAPEMIRRQRPEHCIGALHIVPPIATMIAGMPDELLATVFATTGMDLDAKMYRTDLADGSHLICFVDDGS